MLGDYQTYDVTVKFTFEAEVFPEDPDDVFELAQLEAKSIDQQLRLAFSELEVQSLTVTPVIGE